MINLKNIRGHVPIPGGGELPHPPGTDVQEVGQEGDLIQSPEVGDDLRAPEEGAPTQETETDVHDLNPEIKSVKKKRKSDPKPHLRATAQAGDPAAPAGTMLPWTHWLQGTEGAGRAALPLDPLKR